MMKKLFLLFLGLWGTFHANLYAQSTNAVHCQTSEMTETFYQAHPNARQGAVNDYLETITKMNRKTLGGDSAPDTFRIAVVFHVYGTIQSGKVVDDQLIIGAVEKLNEDFHGLNNDFNTVHQNFMPHRAIKNIKFYLAKFDPNGNPTTGIVYYPAKNGYGNVSATYDAQIQQDAWDNFSYVNVYVQNDLYSNGVFTNSGLAFYPNTYMTENNLARIVYNGAYLHTNTDPEFASVLTHEFGHFFNLIHTFENGCGYPNDFIQDTPPCTSAQGCHGTPNASGPVNCYGQLINAENYMDYNASCYKMFTIGQVARMDTALYLPSRITLWQDSTIIKTGIYTAPTHIAGNHLNNTFELYPNPNNGQLNIQFDQGKTYQVIISNLMGQVVYKNKLKGGKHMIDISRQAKGFYMLKVSDGEKTGVKSFIVN